MIGHSVFVNRAGQWQHHRNGAVGKQVGEGNNEDVKTILSKTKAQFDFASRAYSWKRKSHFERRAIYLCTNLARKPWANIANEVIDRKMNNVRKSKILRCDFDVGGDMAQGNGSCLKQHLF